MKKVFTIISAVIISTILNSCGGFSMPEGSNANASTPQSSVLGNLISTFAGGLMTNQQTIIGTWTYVKPCVQFDSDNALAKAGGAVAATNMETKLTTYYQLVGIKQGAFSFTFNSDNTCSYTLGKRKNTGKYTFDGKARTITITNQMGNNVTAYVSVTGTSMGLTFDASKLLVLLNGASSKVASLSSITALTSSFNGMKIGFELKK